MARTTREVSAAKAELRRLTAPGENSDPQAIRDAEDWLKEAERRAAEAREAKAAKKSAPKARKKAEPKEAPAKKTRKPRTPKEPVNKAQALVDTATLRDGASFVYEGTIKEVAHTASDRYKQIQAMRACLVTVFGDGKFSGLIVWIANQTVLRAAVRRDVKAAFANAPAGV